MQERLSTTEAATCRKIAAKLGSAFDFDATDEGKEYWQSVVENLCRKWKHRTSDGKPYVDPPLTDQDACVWPRLLVMVRDKDTEPWRGPFQYVGKDTASDCSLKYMVWGTDGYHEWYEQARRATPEEIEAAK